MTMFGLIALGLHVGAESAHGDIRTAQRVIAAAPS